MRLLQNFFLFIILMMTACTQSAATSPMIRPTISPTPASIDNVTYTGEPIGRMIVTQALDEHSCAVNMSDSFSRSETVYVVIENVTVPRDTRLMVRLYYDGYAYEDTPQLVAERDYADICVYFAFEATTGAEVLGRGSYEAVLLVNGEASDSVRFQVE